MSPIFYAYKVQPHPTGGWIIVETDDAGLKPHRNQLPLWFEDRAKADAMAAALQDAHGASVGKMLADYHDENEAYWKSIQGPPTAWEAATKGRNIVDVIEWMANLAAEFKRAHPEATDAAAMAEARRVVEAEGWKR